MYMHILIFKNFISRSLYSIFMIYNHLNAHLHIEKLKISILEIYFILGNDCFIINELIIYDDCYLFIHLLLKIERNKNK